ncbi:hypothetical protein UPYG_G00117230 [Umbra pygmaea]|uniref:BHLH domain-containing protein n=1 Tax=Umbra pygmaea TaxID=75934 RepID=A0ABD0XLI3_UMBPY
MKIGRTDNRKMDRKTQVEKRRRERINQSLENLKTLLLQGPKHQGVTQRRVEKSEILEHTVLFLQNTGNTDRTKAEAGEKQRPFQDGFSACQHRAVHFLGHEREGLQLETALNCIFSGRLKSHACVNTNVDVRAQASNSLPSTPNHQSSCLQITDSHTRPQLCAVVLGIVSHPHRAPFRQAFPNAPQETSRDAAKEVNSQNLSISQTVWRPWP